MTLLPAEMGSLGGKTIGPHSSSYHFYQGERKKTGSRRVPGKVRRVAGRDVSVWVSLPGLWGKEKEVGVLVVSLGPWGLKLLF